MKKKVGILTFQWSYNYGATLQAYALKTYLEKMGYEVSIINYTKKYKRKRKKIDVIIKNIMLQILLIPYRNELQEQKDRFNKFRDEFFNLTEEYKSIKELEKTEFDYIVCGSDQIWNSKLTGGYLEEAYFANFKTDARKVAYAASIGEKNISEKDNNDFKNLISNFDCISVRESQMVNEIKKFTDKKIENVVDPTLLLEEKDYSDIATKRLVNERYLLIYQNTRNNEVYKIAQSIAKEKDLKIIEVGYRKQYPETGIPIIQNAGPAEFLSLYKNANYIVTNTFHGTVFAIQFKKDFISIPLKGRETRVASLAQKLNLTTRLLNSYSEYEKSDCMHNKIDYNKVIKLLETERNKSITYLKNSLKE